MADLARAARGGRQSVDEQAGASVTPFVGGASSTITALPVALTLQLYQGDDFSFTIAVTNPDGSAMNLTGYSVSGQIKAKGSDTTALATFTCALTNPTGGIITVTLPAAQSLLVTTGAVFDIQMTSGAPVTITTLVSGTITMTGDVTRP